jgi:hypothetical protein
MYERIEIDYTHIEIEVNDSKQPQSNGLNLICCVDEATQRLIGCCLWPAPANSCAVVPSLLWAIRKAYCRREHTWPTSSTPLSLLADNGQVANNPHDAAD